MTLDDAGEFGQQALSTIICEGDAIGAVVICNKDEKKNPNNVRTDSFEIIPSESEEKDKGVNEEKNDENK